MLSLHFLSVFYRVKFKILTMTFIHAPPPWAASCLSLQPPLSTFTSLSLEQHWMTESFLHTLLCLAAMLLLVLFPVLGLLFHSSHCWTSIYPLRPPRWYSLGSLLPPWVRYSSSKLPHYPAYFSIIAPITCYSFISWNYLLMFLSPNLEYEFLEVMEVILFIFLFRCLAESDCKWGIMIKTVAIDWQLLTHKVFNMPLISFNPHHNIKR